MSNQLTLLPLGFIVSVIGALPFGLVNLTVLDVANKKGNRTALKISHGAAIVEIFFAVVALLLGSLIQQYIYENRVIHYFIIIILFITGSVFFIKKRKIYFINNSDNSGFFKGVLLNIVSLQVFLFWLIAIAYLSSRQFLDYNYIAIILFVIGIWIGKMTVLYLYILLSNQVVSKSQILSNNMDKIIGIVLLIITVIQIIKL